MAMRPWKWVVVFVIVMAAILVPGTTARGGCLVVDLPAPVQLPDGRAFAARELAICTIAGGAVNLREIRLDGSAVGAFMTRVPSVTTTTTREEPFMLFDRFGSDCVLRLTAFGEVSDSSLAVFRIPRAARDDDDDAMIEVLCRGREPGAEGPFAIAASSGR